MTTLTPSIAAARPTLGMRAQLAQLIVIVVGLLVHAYNMFGYPLFLGDEGIFMAQAWAVLRQAALAPYTYQYDHAPGGWLLIAVWSLFTGGFHTFGTAVDGGRVLMLLIHGVSLLFVFRIALSLSDDLPVATAASLLFTLSPLSVLYGRMVLLQNIMVFWLLLAVLLMLRHNGRLWPLMASAACFGVAVMTQETALLFAPALLFGLYTVVQRYHARFARAGWLFIALSIMSLYVLFAALKKELVSLDLSSPLAGSGGEVNLIGTMLWQLSRSGGAPWNASSDFARWLSTRWLVADAWLLGLGSLAALWSVVRGPNTRRIVGLMGLCAIFALAHGGSVLEFHILIALPWLALNAGLFAGDLARSLRIPGASVLASAGAVSLTALSLYNSPDLFTLNLTHGQREALGWVQAHVPPGSHLIIDDDIWVDLHEGANGAPSFANAHSHWKASLDPAIWIDFFDDNWRKVDYMVLTPGLDKVFAADKRFPWKVYNQSQTIARFGTGDATVEIRKVSYPGFSTRSAMDQTWEGFKQRFVRDGQVKVGDAPVRAENQASALLMAVWMDDHATFDQLWAWAKLHMRDGRGLLYGTSGGDGAADTGIAAADTDAAMALVLAANRWQEQRYATDARDIARAIWQHYVVTVNGKPYMAAGDWAITPEQVVFAPGAFSPAAYHLFASVDPNDNWWYLLDTGYALLAHVSSDPLGETHSAGLPPASVGIDRKTGALIADPLGASKGASDFDTAAAEVYWRVALDLRLHNDGRATSFLQGSKLLGDEWRRKGSLAASYSHAGPPTSQVESDALYSAVLPKLVVENPSFGDSVYATKIAPRYSRSGSYAVWGNGENLDEYRMAWIANALYGRALNDDWSNKAVAPYNEPVFDDWRTDPNFNIAPLSLVVTEQPALKKGAK